MKFKITREALIRPLQSLGGVVEKRQTLPILSNVLLDTQNGGLTLVATDLEVELRINLPLEGVAPGRTSVSARKFNDICRSLPENSILDVVLDNDRVFIRSGRSRFTLATLSGDEFPATEAAADALQLSMPQKVLKELIERTHFAMAHQDVRYYLNGMLLELGEGRVTAVATDGHRLALYETACELHIAEPQQVIVPRKAVMELVRLLEASDETVGLEVASNQIRFSMDGTTFTSKLIDGRFPDYQRVLPQGGDKRVIAEREPLRQALVRTSILSNEKFRSVRFGLTSGSLRLLANNPEQEEAEEEVAVDYAGEPLEIGFNVNYFLDALSGVAQDQVEVVLSDPDSCCLIQGVGVDNCKYVVMPMRI